MPQQVIQRVKSSGYVIQLIAFRWDTACIHSSPDTLFLVWVWFVRLRRKIIHIGGAEYKCVLMHAAAKGVWGQA